jgi:hypothetical protein
MVSTMSRTELPRHPGGGGQWLCALTTTGYDYLPEIRCRCDGGPHRSLGIAAQGYAAALSVEVRYGEVDIFADPGTYCYLGDAPWRSYFRSMAARDIPGSGDADRPIGGRALRYRHTHARKPAVVDHGDVANWAAEHDGCFRLNSPVRHRRSVLLDRASRIVDIVDQIGGGGHDICSAFHFGPEIQVELGEFCAFLSWPGSTTPGAARLELPFGLSWSLRRAESNTVPRTLCRRVPAFTLLGSGRCVAGAPLTTRLEFNDTENLSKDPLSQAVSFVSGSCRDKKHENQAGAI